MPTLGKLSFLALVLLAVLSVSTAVYGAPVQNTSPTIETPSIQPTNPGPGDPVTVSVVVYGEVGISNVSIIYTTDNWTSIKVVLPAAYNATSDVATATIPAQSGGGRVSYYVVAYDTSGNRGVNNNAGMFFTFQVPAGPGGPGTSIASSWGLFVVAALLAIGMGIVLYFTRRKNTASNQTSGRKSNHTRPPGSN